jgi:hypothetical protein
VDSTWLPCSEECDQIRDEVAGAQPRRSRTQAGDGELCARRRVHLASVARLRARPVNSPLIRLHANPERQGVATGRYYGATTHTTPAPCAMPSQACVEEHPHVSRRVTRCASARRRRCAIMRECSPLCTDSSRSPFLSPLRPDAEKTRLRSRTRSAPRTTTVAEAATLTRPVERRSLRTPAAPIASGATRSTTTSRRMLAPPRIFHTQSRRKTTPIALAATRTG